MHNDYERYRQLIKDWQDNIHTNGFLDWDVLAQLRSELKETQIWDLYCYCCYRLDQQYRAIKENEKAETILTELQNLADDGQVVPASYVLLIKARVLHTIDKDFKGVLDTLDTLKAHIEKYDIKDHFLHFELLYYYGLGNFWNGDHNAALKYFYQCVDCDLDDIFRHHKALAYKWAGHTLEYFGNFENAIEYHSRGLKIAQKYGIKSAIAEIQFSIASVYFANGAYQRALEISLEAKNTLEAINGNMHQCYFCLAQLYIKLEKYDLAEEYLGKKMEIDKTFNNDHHLIGSLIYLAETYVLSKQYEKANDTLNIIKEKFTTCESSIHYLMDFYLLIVDYYHQIQDYAQEEEYLNKANELNEKEPTDFGTIEIARKRANLYEVLGKKDIAYDYLEKVYEARNGTIKKQQERSFQMALDKLKADEEREEMQEKAEKEKIAKLQAEAAANVMRESITYASKIQKNLLPLNATFTESFADSSVLWEPRDIVGGDIYWIKHFPLSEGGRGVAGTTLCVADCTGHGVPGAMLTMLVTSALQVIVTHHICDDPAQILYQLDQRLATALNVNPVAAMSLSPPVAAISNRHINNPANDMTINDGCDIAVFFISADGSIRMSTCGLNVFRCDGNEVVRHKGQKIFIGEGKLTSKDSIEIIDFPPNPDNKFYAASDGLFDQLNPERKKFGFKRFESLIIENHSQPLPTISKIAWETMLAHQADQIRCDDVSLVCFQPKFPVSREGK